MPVALQRGNFSLAPAERLVPGLRTEEPRPAPVSGRVRRMSSAPPAKDGVTAAERAPEAGSAASEGADDDAEGPISGPGPRSTPAEDRTATSPDVTPIAGAPPPVAIGEAPVDDLAGPDSLPANDEATEELPPSQHTASGAIVIPHARIAEESPPSRRTPEPPPARTSVPPPNAEATPRPVESAGETTARTRPLLASEALMDDLAPVEPARESARYWCAGLGLGFFALGALPLLDLRPGGLVAAVPSLVVGGIALVAALSRVAYRQRAVAMVVLGLLSGVVGLHSVGAALAAGAGGLIAGLARLMPAVTLAAALLFRARYRAYLGARVALGVALASTIPFVILAAPGLADGIDLGDVGAILVFGTIAASLSGFMGAETTGAGPYLAYAIPLAFSLELTLRALWPNHAPADALPAWTAVVELVTAAVAFTLASTLAALGLFQVLAWRFAADARQIDLHTRPPEPRQARDSGVDWSTRT